jgi:hypothetical protein
MIPCPAKGLDLTSRPNLGWNGITRRLYRQETAGLLICQSICEANDPGQCPLYPLPTLKISLHIELAPSCPAAVATALLAELGTIGFQVECAEAGILICRKSPFRTLGAARRAVGEMVNRVGATVLDSRVEILLPRRRRRRKKGPMRGDSKAA